MVADMQRLESAARLAMGSFEGPVAVVENVPSPRRIAARATTVAMVLAAVLLLAAVI